MFSVRSLWPPSPESRALPESGPPPVHATCAATPFHARPPPGPHLAPHRVRPPFDSRQKANSFDQPLSNFDTSTVTDMVGMFYVRSARALAPPALIGPCSPCTPVRLRRNQPTCTLFRLPARTSLRIVRPPFDSIGRARKCSTSRSAASTRPRSRAWNECSRCASDGPALRATCPDTAPRPPASRSAPRSASHSYGILMPSPFDSAAGGKVQPAAQQLRHLQGHEHGLHVLRALRACPLCPPSLESGLSRACRWRCAIAPHTLLPPGQPAGPHRVPSFFRLGRWLFSSTSHSASSTPPRSRTWSPCSLCARALPPKP
jgi:hypothetical protein